MLKTSLQINNKNVEISIVSEMIDGNHTHVYQVFDLPNPIANIGVIGVSNNQIFAIKFKSNLDDRIGFVVYLDGLNVSQKSGIHSLNEIQESKRENFEEHYGCFIMNAKKPTSYSYLDRYNQMNDANRLFTFTTEDNKGINEILLSDPTLTSRIEIYVWKETEEEYDDMIGNSLIIEESKSKIGAGEATHKKFNTTTALENPTFLGKVTFIHVNDSKVSHLGKPLLSKKDFEIPISDDPMDKVPKS